MTSLSSAIFDQYLHNLDPNRSYFLASDIQQFENLRFRFDDLLKRCSARTCLRYFLSLSPTRAGTNRLCSRVTGILGFNFEIDEDYTVNREHEHWACEYIEELNELWRKRVKYDWLALKLAGKDTLMRLSGTLSTRVISISIAESGKSKRATFLSYLMNTYLSAVEPHTGFFHLVRPKTLRSV